MVRKLALVRSPTIHNFNQVLNNNHRFYDYRTHKWYSIKSIRFRSSQNNDSVYQLIFRQFKYGFVYVQNGIEI